MSKVFIDTNIHVYALDKRDKSKQARAREILRETVRDHQPVASTQVLKEFYVIATAKLHVDPIVAKNLIHSFRNMEIVTVDSDLIEQAIDICVLFKLSFWDSLILAAAEKASCEFVLSEDLNHSQSYRGVIVTNPFMDADT